MAQAPAIEDDRLVELLDLIGGADTVELKLTVPISERRATVEALALDPLDSILRQVFFFDTPDLALERAGLVVRARRTQGKPDDSVVKLRPVVPGELSDEIRAEEAFGVEVDAMPGGYVCSASLKGVIAPPVVRQTVQRGDPLRKLFSKEQRSFFAEHAPDGIALDDLSVLGPIFVLKLKFSPAGLGRKMVAEVWLYPDESRILELSTKCLTTEAFQAAAEARAFLTEAGIDLSGEQQTKTRRALEFFSARLAR
jgi:hypothetical protein